MCMVFNPQRGNKLDRIKLAKIIQWLHKNRHSPGEGWPSSEIIHRKWCFFCLHWWTGKVFVHCAMGLSRSSSLVLAYLMIHENMTLVDAIRAVSANRNISPNNGFLEQLRELDKKLHCQGSLSSWSFSGRTWDITYRSMNVDGCVEFEDLWKPSDVLIIFCLRD